MAACMAVAVAGLLWAGIAHSLATGLAAFTLAAIGFWSLMGPFWALPTRMLGGQAAAGGVAIITMIGSLGGLLGPLLTGRLRDLTNSFTTGLFVLAATTAVGAALCLLLPARASGAKRE